MSRDSDPTYVVRYGPDRYQVFLVLLCAALAALPLYALTQAENAEQWAIGSLTASVFVVAVVYRLVIWAYRRVAFRVDATGVTLGVPPPKPANRIAFVPWSDVRRIVLWTLPVNQTTVRYIGVDRVEGAPPLPGSARNKVWRTLNTIAAGGMPEDIVADSRPINGWRLDVERLAKAVSHFAPHVEIVDLG